jgi:hypothetical protein
MCYVLALRHQLCDSTICTNERMRKVSDTAEPSGLRVHDEVCSRIRPSRDEVNDARGHQVHAPSLTPVCNSDIDYILRDHLTITGAEKEAVVLLCPMSTTRADATLALPFLSLPRSPFHVSFGGKPGRKALAV